jgi:pimeloyl-ACP methyl ester carboxylesterase
MHDSYGFNGWFSAGSGVKDFPIKNKKTCIMIKKILKNKNKNKNKNKTIESFPYFLSSNMIFSCRNVMLFFAIDAVIAAIVFAYLINSKVPLFPCEFPTIEVFLPISSHSLSYRVIGPENGFPVFSFQGDPHSSGFIHPEAERLSEELNLRVFFIDRPGIWKSTARIKETVYGNILLDFADDIIQFSQELGISKFSVLGHSAGTVFALAIAHRFPRKVMKVGLVGPVLNSSLTNGGHDKMSFQNEIISTLSRKNPSALSYYVGIIINILRKASGDQILIQQALDDFKNNGSGNSSCQKWKDLLLCSASEFFSQSNEPFVEELIGCSGDWGFDLREISIDVDIWTGRKDTMTPSSMAFVMGETLIKNSKIHSFDNVGHYSILSNHYREILQALQPTR